MEKGVTSPLFTVGIVWGTLDGLFLKAKPRLNPE